MIDVSGFPRDDRDCGWWHLNGPEAGYPSLQEELSCDYAIVGAGWTGLAAAHRLSNRLPDASIAVIDAGRIGFGAAGRNSGFLYDLPFVFPEDAYRGREEDGRQEIALYRQAIGHLRAFVRDHEVDCDWSEIGQYHVAAGPSGERDLATIRRALGNLEEPYRSLDPSERADALGTDYYRGAIHTPGTVQVDPLALVRAYSRGLPENVCLYEQSPVTRIETMSNLKVVTAEGSIRASRVLVTVNAFLHAMSGIRPRILPLMTFSSLTEAENRQGTDRSNDLGQWGLVPAALFGTSMRRLKDGRLLVRNTYAYAPAFEAGGSLRTRAFRRHLLSLRRRFPDAEPPHVERSWGGVISLFRGANGFFGEIAPGVFAATTAGMPLCVLYGQQLAEYALGGSGDALDFVRRRSQPGALPPEPFTGPVARSAAAWHQFRARREI